MKIKICGIKTIEAARTAAENGGAMLGFIFYPPSPRYLAPEKADELVRSIAGFEKRPALVGVFVNVAIAEMAAAVERYGLDYLQVSGEESPALVAELTRIRPVIKALRLPANIVLDEALEQAESFGKLERVSLLLDTHKKGMYGGTGEIGDWEAAQAIAARYPTLLSGGLTPENVAQAGRQVQPWGVDVSSGVEQDGAPGEKNLNKIIAFCQAAKRTEN